ncbi:hypothetical protein ACHAXR_012080 [Thalassiosira sp. AJA248-18]
MAAQPTRLKSGGLKCALVPIMILFFYTNITVSPTSLSALDASAYNNATNDPSRWDGRNTSYITINNTNISIPLAKSLLNKKTQAPFDEINIYRLSPNLTTSPNTIVTAYFRLASKHGASQYDVWMKNMLSMQDHMVVITSPELLPQIAGFRKHALDRTVVMLMELDDIPIGTLFPTEFWVDQLERNPEKKTHQSYQLFWIWLAKTGLVNDCIGFNFFESDLFLWSDIGAFREGNYNGRTLIQHRELVPPHEMMQMAHNKPNPPKEDLFYEKFKHYANFYHSGMQFVAYKDTWKVFYEYFLDTIDKFLEHNMLIVDDQVILQSVCLQHPEICAYVPCDQVNDRRYRALRYVLHYGGKYNLWRYNKTKTDS